MRALLSNYWVVCLWFHKRASVLTLHWIYHIAFQSLDSCGLCQDICGLPQKFKFCVSFTVKIFMKFIDFVGTKNHIQKFCLQYIIRNILRNKQWRNSLSRKIDSNFLRYFLYPIAVILSFALHPSSISSSSKYSIIKTLSSSTRAQGPPCQSEGYNFP